jgi:hypothetical protein
VNLPKILVGTEGNVRCVREGKLRVRRRSQGYHHPKQTDNQTLARSTLDKERFITAHPSSIDVDLQKLKLNLRASFSRRRLHNEIS